jgi:hypothetical protein
MKSLSSRERFPWTGVFTLGLTLFALTACTGSNLPDERGTIPPPTPPTTGNPTQPPTPPPPTPPLTPPPPSPSGNIAAYAGNAGNERFNAVVALSDGSFLIGGSAQNLDWIPSTATRIALPPSGIDSASSGNVGFLLHLSSDYKTILQVASFPTGTVRDVNRIRLSNLPGATTSGVFISGARDSGSSDGYYLARLNANFVSGNPTGFSWTHNVNAGGDHKERQPWDVGGDGKVVYALGLPIAADWAAVQRLGVNGQPEIVENWSAHWGTNGEWDGTPASSYKAGTLSYSAVVMKAGRKGSLRSRSQGEFDAQLADGNGLADRQGSYPDDYYFATPCDPSGTCASSGPGYTGYKTSGKPTQRVGGIAVDRRNNDIFIGYGTQTVLPGGNPDFEPAVAAMDATGKLKWWSRLYSERIKKPDGTYTTTSSPDQYVDFLALDYSSGCAGGCLVVLARAHGNNVINFWSGDKIAANPTASGAKNSFSGTSGNIHISWIGKLQLGSGTLQRATWLAEWAEGANIPIAQPSGDANLDGWPNLNTGWVDLNTTRAQALEVDVDGRVYVTAVGRRTLTTKTAFQKMIKPADGASSWNAFARVYSSDLSKIEYSSLLVGTWDPKTQVGGDNTELRGIAPLSGGLLAVGYGKVDSATGTAKGNPIPTSSVPAWGSATPSFESAIFAAFKY